MTHKIFKSQYDKIIVNTLMCQYFYILTNYKTSALKRIGLVFVFESFKVFHLEIVF